MHVLLTLTLATIVFAGGVDLCFFQDARRPCGFHPVGTPAICCTDIPSGLCCKNEIAPDFCGYLSAESFRMETFHAAFYKTANGVNVYDEQSYWHGVTDPRDRVCSKGVFKNENNEEEKLEKCSSRWMIRAGDLEPPRPERLGSSEHAQRLHEGLLREAEARRLNQPGDGFEDYDDGRESGDDVKKRADREGNECYPANAVQFVKEFGGATHEVKFGAQGEPPLHIVLEHVRQKDWNWLEQHGIQKLL